MAGHGFELDLKDTVTSLNGQPFQKSIQGSCKGGNIGIRSELTIQNGPSQPVGEHLFRSESQLLDSFTHLSSFTGDVDGGEYHHAAAG